MKKTLQAFIKNAQQRKAEARRISDEINWLIETGATTITDAYYSPIPLYHG